MKRCSRKQDLEIHHIRIDGGNSIDNALVLCQKCHTNTSSYGVSGHTSPKPFSEDTKEQALKKSGHQCECTKGTCCL